MPMQGRNSRIGPLPHWCHVPGVAKSKLKGEIGPEFVAVLNEEVESILCNPVGLCYSHGSSRRDCCANDEVGRGVEYQLAGIVGEIVIPKVAELKAELHGMCSADVVQSVSNYCGKVSASLGEVTFGAEEEPRLVLDRDHRYEH